MNCPIDRKMTFRNFIFCRFFSFPIRIRFVFNCLVCASACTYECVVFASFIFNSFWLRHLNDGSTVMDTNIAAPHPCLWCWRRIVHIILLVSFIFPFFLHSHWTDIQIHVTNHHTSHSIYDIHSPQNSYQCFVDDRKKLKT